MLIVGLVGLVFFFEIIVCFLDNIEVLYLKGKGSNGFEVFDLVNFG